MRSPHKSSPVLNRRSFPSTDSTKLASVRPSPDTFGATRAHSEPGEIRAGQPPHTSATSGVRTKARASPSPEARVTEQSPDQAAEIAAPQPVRGPEHQQAHGLRVRFGASAPRASSPTRVTR